LHFFATFVVANRSNIGDKSLYIHVHSPNEFVFHYSQRGVIYINTTSTNICTLDFSKTIVKYQYEWPGIIACNASISRHNCIFSCIQDRYVNETCGLSPEILTYDRKSEKTFYYNTSLTKIITQSCNDLCERQLDCLKEYYKIDSKTYTYNLMPSNSYTVTLSVPTEPLLIYEIQLKLTFEEYLCLMASVVSLWFGFSVVMLTEYLSHLCTKCYNYYMHRNDIQFNVVIKPVLKMFKLKSIRKCLKFKRQIKVIIFK